MTPRSSLRSVGASRRTARRFVLESVELLFEEVELELGGDRLAAQSGVFRLQSGDRGLLADDGFLEEKSGLLEGVNVPDLLQPWHAQ